MRAVVLSMVAPATLNFEGQPSRRCRVPTLFFLFIE